MAHRPAVALDADVVHEGRQSLRVWAEEASDTALGQDIALEPSGWYRFTDGSRQRASNAWTPRSRARFRSSDRLIAAPSPRAKATRETRPGLASSWCLQSPADGHVRIAPFLVGYGKGRGTAWFDEMAIERIDPSDSPVVITREFLRPARINPYQYGQFIEYLCTMVPAMWAEKLFDGSFEGLSPYKVAYLKETDFRERPWYPSGATNRARFERDESTKVSGERSLQDRTVGGETPCTVSIAQDGIAVAGRPGLRLRLLPEAERVERTRSACGCTAIRPSMLPPSSTRRADWTKQRVPLVPSQNGHERHAHDRVSRARDALAR